MMAAVILVVSVATLLMFFVSYCRSLTASALNQPVSAEVRDVTGIHAHASGQDFSRVLQLLQLCPDHHEDRGSLQAVTAYYDMLAVVHGSLWRLAPWVQTWAEREQSGCANFAMVTLDRRIAFSRAALTEGAEF
jgi:hypothetical protein